MIRCPDSVIVKTDKPGLTPGLATDVLKDSSCLMPRLVKVCDVSIAAQNICLHLNIKMSSHLSIRRCMSIVINCGCFDAVDPPLTLRSFSLPNQYYCRLKK